MTDFADVPAAEGGEPAPNDLLQTAESLLDAHTHLALGEISRDHALGRLTGNGHESVEAAEQAARELAELAASAISRAQTILQKAGVSSRPSMFAEAIEMATRSDQLALPSPLESEKAEDEPATFRAGQRFRRVQVPVDASSEEASTYAEEQGKGEHQFSAARLREGILDMKHLPENPDDADVPLIIVDDETIKAGRLLIGLKPDHVFILNVLMLTRGRRINGTDFLRRFGFLDGDDTGRSEPALRQAFGKAMSYLDIRFSSYAHQPLIDIQGHHRSKTYALEEHIKIMDARDDEDAKKNFSS